MAQMDWKLELVIVPVSDVDRAKKFYTDQLGFTDGLEFCRRLPELAGVVAIPPQVFYDDVEAGRPLVRWAFCKQPAVIDEALRRLRQLLPT